VKTSGIYKIVNKINGKYYIGSAKDVYDRWSDHKKDLKKTRHHNRHLQRAWDKYGRENFELVIVETCAPEALLDREQEHLTHCKSVPDTNYNMIYEAGGGGDFAPEIIEKMKKNHADFRGEKNPRYGIHLSEETKQKIRAKAIARQTDPSKRPMLGKHHSEATRQKLRDIRLAHYRNSQLLLPT
jgi:group I intron endonuclease